MTTPPLPRHTPRTRHQAFSLDIFFDNSSFATPHATHTGPGFRRPTTPRIPTHPYPSPHACIEAAASDHLRRRSGACRTPLRHNTRCAIRSTRRLPIRNTQYAIRNTQYETAADTQYAVRDTQYAVRDGCRYAIRIRDTQCMSQPFAIRSWLGIRKNQYAA